MTAPPISISELYIWNCISISTAQGHSVADALLDNSYFIGFPSKSLPSGSVEISHYNDVIMGVIASEITSLTIVFSTVYLDTDQIKHSSSASLAFVWGIHRRPVNSPHKWPVTRKMFPFDDVIMILITVAGGHKLLTRSCLKGFIVHKSDNTCDDKTHRGLMMNEEEREHEDHVEYGDAKRNQTRRHVSNRHFNLILLGHQRPL